MWYKYLIEALAFMHFNRYLEQKIKQYLTHKKSILLLGPRQTGKSTLIEDFLTQNKNKEILSYKLQNIKIFQSLIKDPTLIANEVERKLEKVKSLILFIDEVQKIPILLDDCQYLIDTYKERILTILTGSSARKLRQKGVNLLPGRVIVENIHPLILPEIINQEEQNIVPLDVKKKYTSKVSLSDLLIYGSLPKIAKETRFKETELNSYVENYLQEEIRQEALTRNLHGFSNFLELAAFESNSSPNLSKLSQETGIPASTIKNYFDILEDTLNTYTIQPFRKPSRKQILTTPKYIFFDLGVRNVACHMPLNKQILNTETSGKLFEQFVILELIRRIKYKHRHWKYYFWRTNNGLEVDFIIQTEDEVIPIEIKYTSVPQKNHIKHLEIFMEEYKCKKGYLVGLFPRAQKLTDKIDAIPWSEI